MDKLFPLFDIPVPFYPGLTEKFQFVSGMMFIMCFIWIVTSVADPTKQELVQKFGEALGDKKYKANEFFLKKTFSLGLLLFMTGWITGIPFLLFLAYKSVKLLFSGSAEETATSSTNAPA